MNKKNSMETKKLLADTFLELLETKPFPKITVNELCEKSGIVRSTFYLHFQNKYELLSYCINELSAEINSLMETCAPKDFLIVLLSSFQEKEKIFFNIFETELNDDLIEILYQFFSRYITQCLEEKRAKGALLPGSVESVTSFYVSGLIGMTIRWIKSGCRLSKEELASCQYRLLKDILLY